MRHQDYFNIPLSLMCVVLAMGSCQSAPKKEANEKTNTKIDQSVYSKTDIPSQLTLVSQLLDKGNTFEAQRLGLKLARRQDITWYPLYMMNKSFIKKELYGDVIQVLEKTIPIVEKSPPLLFQLCASYMFFGFHKESENRCNQAVALAKSTGLADYSPRFFRRVVFYHAKSAYYLNQDDLVISRLAPILKGEKGHCEGRYLQAKTYFRKQTFKKSLKSLKFMSGTCRQRFPKSFLLEVLALARNNEGPRAKGLIRHLIKQHRGTSLAIELEKLKEIL